MIMTAFLPSVCLCLSIFLVLISHCTQFNFIMDLLIEKSKSDVNIPSTAVATARRKPSIDEKAEMAGFFRSLSQRFRSQSTRQPRPNLNGRGEGPDKIRSNQKSAPALKIDHRRECLCKVLLLDGTDVNIIVSVSFLFFFSFQNSLTEKSIWSRCLRTCFQFTRY